jgi:pimeloyl-ACP methyl ester carboxylesterase
MARFEQVVGRYIHLTIQGIEYRVFYEEAGHGIPLIAQHSGGGDGMEWRALLSDPEITAKYHVIVPNLPYHGRSMPPESIEWWRQEYQLKKNFFMDFHLELSRELKLDRPVYMGCYVGGNLGLNLALEHPDKFRAVIGVGAALTGGTPTLDTFYHPNVTNDYRRTNGMYFCAPMTPEKYRREVTWCCMQCAAPTTKGDLYFYFYEHNLTGKAHLIDTSKCAVYLFTGDYDPTLSVEDTMEMAKQIKGAKFTEMKGLNHAGMQENPPLFKSYIMPALDEIAANSKKK